ncbi:Phage replication protein O [Enterobacter intestinihominis]
MARSRNIKPGFFTNDELAECQPLARILFAGLWTIADKEGRLDDRPKKIKAMVLPFDDVDCDALLQQLHQHKFINRYQVKGDSYIQVSNWKKHQNPHCKEAASEIPEPSQNQNGTEQEQCNSDAKEEKEEEGKPQVIENNEAQERHGASKVQEQVKNSLNPADSLNLIPDSPIPDPDSLVNTQAAYASCEEANADIHEISSRYAFEGQIVRLNHKDYQAWLNLYPLIDLNYELQKLDIEFTHEKPKNWFITASQKLSYQNKQAAVRGKPAAKPDLDFNNTDWAYEVIR